MLLLKQSSLLTVSLQDVWHRCHICDELVLMDKDVLGGHIKGTHNMKEKEYKEQFCIYKQKPRETRQEERPQKKLKGSKYLKQHQHLERTKKDGKKQCNVE